jgi:6-phosphogluconolactonase (cycloisomerase 2 family)
VLRLRPDLTVDRRYGCQDCLGGFVDFAVEDGAVWALETQGGKLFRFREDGGIERTFEVGDHVGFPVSLALDPTGFVYVLDRHRSSVAVYGVDGRFRYRFLGPGQAQGQLQFPRQLRFDPWGRLCIVDEGNGRVEIFSR